MIAPGVWEERTGQGGWRFGTLADGSARLTFPPMKFAQTSGCLAGLVAGAVLFAFAGSEARAQLNEKRVMRDATGLYNGQIRGGHLTIVGATGSYVTPPSKGRLRVVMRKGGQEATTKNPALAGDDSAEVSGSFKKVDVRRNGKQIAVAGQGSAEEDTDTFGSWRGGRMNGNFTDRGPKWNANTTVLFATRRHIGDPGDANDDFTEQIRDLSVTGKD